MFERSEKTINTLTDLLFCRNLFPRARCRLEAATCSFLHPDLTTKHVDFVDQVWQGDEVQFPPFGQLLPASIENHCSHTMRVEAPQQRRSGRRRRRRGEQPSTSFQTEVVSSQWRTSLQSGANASSSSPMNAYDLFCVYTPQRVVDLNAEVEVNRAA